MTIEDVYKKYDSVLYPQMYSLALVKDFMKKTFDMAVKDCNEYYQNELDEVYKNYADRLKDVLKKNEKLKIKVAYRHEVQTMLEKRIAELEKENAELKGEADSVLDNWCKGNDPCPHLKKRDEQLTKAKELLKQFLKAKNGEDTYKAEWEAQQFLSEVEK